MTQKTCDVLFLSQEKNGLFFEIPMLLYDDRQLILIGPGTLPKGMNFWKSSKQPLTPPLVFGNLVANFSEHVFKNLFNGPKSAIWTENDRPPTPLQLFPKFICFGDITPPLPSYGNKFSINTSSRLTKPARVSLDLLSGGATF